MSDVAANERPPERLLHNPQKVESELLCADAPTDNTAPKQRGRPFLPGQSGNPSGRPKGKRNRLTALFLEVVEKDFLDNGAAALKKLRENDAASYIRLVASIVPRELILEEEQKIDFSLLSAGEIHDLLITARKDRSYQKFFDELI
ncbi:DUF5681 domain-containing protein [Methylobacterium goesingense]|uniref:DUF5681 domain-containing protein n=2 Tax=Methylobacterium goesingense TaxID=243690 RepID=A0ABV2LB58_9HYPH